MSRSTWIAGALAVLATIAAIVLYVQNGRLEDENARLRARPDATATAAADPWSASSTEASGPDRDGPAARRGLGDRNGNIASADAPALPDPGKETRMQRRARRQQQIADLLGRQPGESDEDYKKRVLPLMEAALAKPRADVEDMRKQAEELANVTPDQHKQLDALFDKTYGDLIDYTNQAISDGQLSPYERNVAGMLDYAGGLGGFLSSTEGNISKILSPDQIATMKGNGFEWGEYLGVEAPWERLNPPPPPPQPGGGS